MKLTIYNLRWTPAKSSASSRITHHAISFTQHSTRDTQLSSPVTRHSSHSLAFTLIELMVAVTLMSLIVLGLLTMFNQTQKAFRASMTQTDVLESGRIVTDMIARELGQMAACYQTNTTNFFAELSPFFSSPMMQGLPGTTRGAGQDRRTNIVQRLFFLSQFNQTWNGTGYEVLPDTNSLGTGTLYRFNLATNRYAVNVLSSNFQYSARIAALSVAQGKPVTNLSRISDGVVHFRLRAFATNGYPILWDGNTGLVPKFQPIPFTNTPPDRTWPVVRNAFATNSLRTMPEIVDCYFSSNALPAYLELELGILEPHIMERFKAISGANPQAQQRYLSNHVAQVHLFRQRIPIRTVDFSAYQ